MFSPRHLMNMLVVLACAGLALGAGSAVADPPARVARLAYIQGPVSFAPAGEDEWVVAELNRPLVPGDRLWSDVGARTELQIGSAAVRLGASTSASVLNIDAQIAQFEVTQGSVYVSARYLEPSQIIEIDTPNLAFSVTRPGTYRIDVDPNGDSTGVVVWTGQADVYGEGAAYTISSGQAYRFYATGLQQSQYAALPPPDDFDQWSASRDQRYESASASRYVAPEVVGYEDLDQYGTWSDVPQYGHVWFPSRVAADWAPYRDGRWTWIEPWGWTWVDAAPWGFAPYHYGRWAYVSRRWCWVPGPRTVRPVYAPALVAFVGGSNFSLTVSAGPAVAWFPLAPGEVYRPAYRVSHDYFTRVNVTNTVVNTTIVNNFYNNRATNVVYRNRQEPHAVTAVPRDVFADSKLVMPSRIGVASVDLSKLQAAPVTAVAAVAPSRTAVLGDAQRARHRPSEQVLKREVVAKSRPAPLPASFESRQEALARQPGRPLEANAAASSPGKRPEERRVRVVTASRPPEPAPKGSETASPVKGQPPGREEAAKSREEAAQSAERTGRQQQEQPARQQEQERARQAQQQERERAQQAAGQQQEQRAQQQEQQRAKQAAQQQERERAQQAARQQQEQRAQQQEQQRAKQAAQQQERERAQQAARQQQEQRAQQEARQQQQEQQRSRQAQQPKGREKEQKRDEDKEAKN